MVSSWKDLSKSIAVIPIYAANNESMSVVPDSNK